MMRTKMLSLLVLFTTAATSARAEMRKDIEYARAGDVPLLLNASVPAGDGPFPIVVFVHGGGWNTGDRVNDIKTFAASLDAANFVTLSIEYRLAPTHRWPACFEDVQTALRWAHDHARDVKGDPDRIAIMGYSAGGQLALLAGSTAGATPVRAVVGLAPPSDFEQDLAARGGLSTSLQDLLGRPKAPDDAAIAQLREIGPIQHVKPGLPPFLIIQGAADKTVPSAQSIAFQAKCREAGVPCDLILIPKAGHRLREWKEGDPMYQQKLITWLTEKLSPAATTTRPTTLP